MKTISLTELTAAGLLLTATFVGAQYNPDPRAQMISPTPGSTLPGATVTFTWSDAVGGGDYFLRIGSIPFGTDIFNAVVRVTSVTLLNLPTNGVTIYVALFTKLRGEYQAPFEYTYTAANTGSPAPTTITVAGKTATFSNTSQNVALTATVTAASAVNQGTVAFQVMDGAINVGTTVTSGTLTNGSAGAIYVLPAGTAPKDYTIRAAYSGGPRFLAASGAGTLAVSPAAPAQPAIAAVTHAASYRQGAVSPGLIVTLWGDRMGPVQLSAAQPAADGKFPTALAGTRALFDGVPGAVLYASLRQVSVAVPYSVDGRASAQLVLESNGQRSDPYQLVVTDANPDLFTADGSGAGPGAILNVHDDGTVALNTAQEPAPRGSYISAYLTGEGQTNPGGVDGLVAAGVPPKPRLTVTATIGGVPAPVQYAGGAPYLLAGVMQVNLLVPQDAPVGPAVPLKIQVGDKQSQAAITVAVGN